jgi:hypothetical protein
MPSIPGNVDLDTVKKNMKERKRMFQFDPAKLLFQTKKNAGLMNKRNKVTLFAFQSVFWREANFEICLLRQNYRQGCSWFLDGCRAIRRGDVKDVHALMLKRTCRLEYKSRNVRFGDGEFPLQVFGIKKKVTESNLSKLEGLPSKAFEFPAIDKAVPLDKYTGDNWKRVEENLILNDFLRNESRMDKMVRLGVGACVIVAVQSTQFKDLGILSGVSGTVTSFVVRAKIRNENGRERFVRSRDLPWFGDGQVKKHKDLTVNMEGCILSKKWLVVARSYLPVVTFHDVGCHSLEGVIVYPYTMTHDVPDQGTCVRTQLPLRLGWSVTSHCVQGLQRKHVEFDMEHCWEYGQAYTVISRCRDPKGLYIKNWEDWKVKCHPLALLFDDACRAGKEEVRKILKVFAGFWWYDYLFDKEIPDLLIAALRPNGNPSLSFTHRFCSWVAMHTPVPKGFGTSAYNPAPVDLNDGWAMLKRMVNRNGSLSAMLSYRQGKKTAAVAMENCGGGMVQVQGRKVQAKVEISLLEEDAEKEGKKKGALVDGKGTD